MSSAAQACFCLAGWRFHQNVLETLAASGYPVYLVSHRSAGEAPPYLFDYLPRDQVFFTPNLGYDWGCYQQFLELSLWQAYQTIFFLHDDLEIHSLDFIPHTLDLLANGALIIGNGRNSHLRRWPRTHLACYAHSRWLPPDRDFEHDTVRGSFFAVQAETLRRLETFEIFWDPHHLHIRFGNHSLIATCGKIQALADSLAEGRKAGPSHSAFAYLGEDYRASPYLVELERGQPEAADRTASRSLSPRQRIATQAYIWLGEAYVKYRLRHTQVPRPPSAGILACQRLLYWMNGASNFLQ